MRKALIFGIGGQDGSYLAELLLEKGYEVHGLTRRTATGNTRNIEHIKGQIELHYGDLTDSISLFRIIDKVRPTEIYNEADQDHAGISFEIPAYNFDVTGAAVGRALEVIRQIDPKIRFFQPVTSNMFGVAESSPQNEKTTFNPQNPYACAKIFAYHLAKFYRQTYGMYVAIGIFYNHESPRRVEDYVTRKITRAVANIKAGKQKKLVLGNMNGMIDWGYAKEYMEAAWRIMQLDQPDDFVVGTGEVHSVQEFVDEAFSIVGLESRDFVESSSELFRPSENSLLRADISKLELATGFKPQVRFKQLVALMMKHDLAEVVS